MFVFKSLLRNYDCDHMKLLKYFLIAIFTILLMHFPTFSFPLLIADCE